MKTTSGNCEECFISSRPATKAVWRVVRTKDELCDACRKTLNYDLIECVPIEGAPMPEANSTVVLCMRGCGKPVHRGRCAGGLANQLIKKIEKRKPQPKAPLQQVQRAFKPGTMPAILPAAPLTSLLATLRADRAKIDEKIAAVEKVVELFA